MCSFNIINYCYIVCMFITIDGIRENNARVIFVFITVTSDKDLIRCKYKSKQISDNYHFINNQNDISVSKLHYQSLML